MAMTLVSTVTVGSGGAASISFSGIAGSGKDLLILVSSRNANSTSELRVNFNSDSGSNFTSRFLVGDGSSAVSYTSTNSYSPVGDNNGSGSTVNTFSDHAIYVPNYTSSVGKSFSTDGVSENNGTTAYQNIVTSRWSGTAAITTVTLTGGGDFSQHSTASLYIIS
jgi:hypothetical protein